MVPARAGARVDDARQVPTACEVWRQAVAVGSPSMASASEAGTGRE